MPLLIGSREKHRWEVAHMHSLWFCPSAQRQAQAVALDYLSWRLRAQKGVSCGVRTGKGAFLQAFLEMIINVLSKLFLEFESVRKTALSM